jgi:ferredoxin-NADP reductase
VTTLLADAARAGEHQHRAYHTETRQLVVTAIEQLTPAVRNLVLADPSGGPLAPYPPGSNLILETGSNRNAYSLIGDGLNPYAYSISVLRRGAGGGSDWLHDHVGVGDLIGVTGPRSHFAAVYDQKHALLVAGGIGITPILSHALAARHWGRTAEIIYAYRPGSGAHLDLVRELGSGNGITLYEAFDRAELRAILLERMADQPLGTHAYACGPAGLLESYLELGRRAGWPAFRLHAEHFSAPLPEPGHEFTVTIASTGAKLSVASGVSLLDSLLAAGAEVPYLCRQGVCGECSIGVRGGMIEHRDHVLSTAERDAGNRMLCCVSRGANIEVDL